ncbi:MAG: RDD family protein [Ilumatobacteraceae bacterium]
MTDESRTAPVLPEGVVLASFMARTGGWLIDQSVAGLPVFLAFLALGKTADEMSTGNAWLWFNVAFLGLGLLHETIGVWRWGRTIGKWICRTKVVHAVDGGSVTLSSAFLRSLVPAAFGVIPTVGSFLGMGVLWWAFFDPRRQGIHDKAAGTLVARNDRFGTRFSGRT